MPTSLTTALSDASLRESLLDLAIEAGKIASKIRKTGFTVEDKGGELGPVTEADRAASEYLMTSLARIFPDDLIVSEEAEPPRSTSAKRVWYIDPIDGTKEFIRGGDDWTVMVGATESGRPVFGIVHRHETGELYHALSGHGAFRRDLFASGAPDHRLHARRISDPSQAVLVLSKSHPSKRVTRAAERLGITRTFQMGSVGLKLSKIAEGEADAYFNFSGMPNLWDLCAAEVILREAGGELLKLAPEAWGSPVPYSLEHLQVEAPFVGAAAGIARPILEALKD